ncbi:MAG TPA: hypothetical protein ENJ53_07830, partial [Phaeodactylibacter sp.]|nr:hypothetical protein [Phaeodactylibacter sp.]
MKKTLLFLFTFLQIFSACSQNDATPASAISQTNISQKQKKQGWDADAGVIPSLTVGSTPSASSNPEMANKIIDEKKETHWQSGQPFPSNFFSRADQNILLHHFSQKNHYQASRISTPKNATDGNPNSTAANISLADGSAFLEVFFEQPQDLKTIVLRAGNVTQPIEIFVKKNNQLQSIGFYKKENDHKIIRFTADVEKCNSIVIKSTQPFSLWEIAALEAAPKEWAMVDLGKIQKIGWVNTRHWAGGGAVSTALFVSTDAKNWTKIKDLDPNAL